ncbi:hypothetical protein D3C77_589030 [compost metagenome]
MEAPRPGGKQRCELRIDSLVIWPDHDQMCILVPRPQRTERLPEVKNSFGAIDPTKKQKHHGRLRNAHLLA